MKEHLSKAITAREVAGKFAESIISCQLKTKDHLANAIESALTQFAEEKVREAIGRRCSHKATYPCFCAREARVQGFSECRELCLKLIPKIQKEHGFQPCLETFQKKIRALTPDGETR